MELTCALPPPVYAELYAMLAEPDRAAELAPRLDVIDRDASWLADMAQSYRRLWQYRLTYLENATDTYEGLAPHHAELATWMLSILRGDSAEFSRALRRRAREELAKATTAGSAHRRAQQPAVVAWTLGCVPGNYDRELPVVFAEEPPDPNVRMAYKGLVQHLIDMGERNEPWPEVVTTSVLWRCAGIAEGLAPQPKPNLEASLNQLMAAIRTRIPGAMWRELADYWDDFRKTRNALTHLNGRNGAPGFADVVVINSGRDQLRNTLVGATHFVADSIRGALADPDSDLGRTSIATAIEDELSWLEGLVAP